MILKKNYFDKFYSKLKIRIVYTDYKTDYFKMERGILQGDHFSNIIFVMCMNYIIDMIDNKYHDQMASELEYSFSCFVDDIERVEEVIAWRG